MHLLVVEDELELAQYLHEGPRENGHVVDLARDDIGAGAWPSAATATLCCST
jgi:DNA-binding response OmpR family regulator